MMRLGSVKVQQKRVVMWHATITQIEDSVRVLAPDNNLSGYPELERDINEILADLGKLRGNLPPIQTKLLL